MAMARGASVITPTSGGGGGPPASLPQATSRAAATSRPAPKALFLFSIARSIRQHSAQQVVEQGEFFFLESFEMYVHSFDHDGPDFRGRLLALGREVQVDHAPVEFAAFATHQFLFLEPVE